MDENLKGLGIVVTRPAHQAKTICDVIAAHGGRPILFPSIAIAKPRQPALVKAAIAQLDRCYAAIFTSANAVFVTEHYIHQRWQQLPPDLAWLSVGPATTHALQKANISPVHHPEQQFSSEGLLALPALQNVQDKRIHIYTGADAKQLLPETLRARGAQVSQVITYRRQCPTSSPQPLLDRWQRGKIDIVICTSEEGLANLWMILGEQGQSHFKQTAVVVVSARMFAFTQAHQWQAPVLIARNPTDAAIMQTLLHYSKEQGHD